MKYKSTLFDEARNKIGSIVASKNRNGNYFRKNVTPSNPRTVYQGQARALFTTLTQAWKGLTDEQRSGWISLGPQVTLRDSLSNTYHPTGQQLYISNNTNLTNAGLAVIDDAPSTPDPAPDIAGPVIVATVGASTPFTHTLTISLTGGEIGEILLINATAQFSPGRNFVGRSQYRLLFSEPLPLTSDVNILSTYELRLGSLVVGSKLSVQVIGITENGFAGQPLRSDIIVTAA